MTDEDQRFINKKNVVLLYEILCSPSPFLLKKTRELMETAWDESDEDGHLNLIINIAHAIQLRAQEIQYGSQTFKP